MKKFVKQFMGVVLSASLVLGSVCVAPSQAYAASKETAVEVSFGTEYNDATQWSKITIKQSGVLTIEAKKPSSSSFGLYQILANLYDSNGTRILRCTNKNNSQETAVIKIPLDKGTYYVGLTASVSGSFPTDLFKYKYTFKAANNIELEVNNTKKTATPIKVDKKYTGYIGAGGFGATYDEIADDCDVYKVTLKKNNSYILHTSKQDALALVYIRGNKTYEKTTKQSYKADDFSLSPEKEFVAPYTGTYYVYVYNVKCEQYEYNINIECTTPKKPTLKSVTSKKKALVVKWSKSKYAKGYNVQYSTNKRFKGAKTITVKGASKLSREIKKLAGERTYNVRVRGYRKVGDKTVYSAWSNVKKAKTKK